MAKKVEDESLVIDLLLDRLEPDQKESIQRRLQEEEDLKQLKEDVDHTLQALQRLPEPQAPEDLIEKTLARIRQDQQMKSLLARQETSRRAFRPTFSLRELAAIAAAAVIMAVVFIPSIRQARNTRYAADCAAQMGQIGSALQSYSIANNNQLPAADLTKKRWLAVPATPRDAAASNSSALFRLVQQSYALPPVFQCPAVGSGSFQAKSGMVDFPAAKYVNYSYQHTLGNTALCTSCPELSGRQSQMAVLADCTPVFDGALFRRSCANDQAVSPNHNGAGQNVLYLDWHVTWADKPTVGVNGDNIYLARGIFDYRGDEAPVDATDSFLLPAYSGN
jgi:prepilin-type processing-associated H-X9-DG protein